VRARNAGAQAFQQAGAAGESRGVQNEDIALMMFETDLGAVGTTTVSQVSPGRKNRLWFELDGADGAIAFDQESPETAWVGRRGGTSLLVRDREQLSPDAVRYATLPGGHPQGWHDCFEAFIRDTYEAIRGEVPDGLPLFSDGLRTVRIMEAVLESARTGAWTEVRS
jgi:predicted dehydrogenase